MKIRILLSIILLATNIATAQPVLETLYHTLDRSAEGSVLDSSTLHTVIRDIEDGKNFKKLEKLVSALFDEKNTNQSTLSAHDIQVNKNGVCLILSTLCRHEIAQLKNQLIEILTILYSNRTYWQKQHDHPTRYFFSKNPLKWFVGPHQKHEIIDAIEQSEEKVAYYSHHLGYLESLDQEFEKIEDIGALEAHICKTAKAIDSCLRSRIVKNNRSISYKKAADLLLYNRNNIAPFAYHVKQNNYDLQKPSHLYRYWIPYSLLGLASMSGYGYWAKNKDLIYKHMEKMHDSGQKFYQNHVVEPITSMSNILFHDKYPENPTLKTNLYLLKEDLEKSNRIFLKNYNDKQPKKDKLPPDILKKYLENPLSEEAQRYLLSILSKQKQSPLTNALFGNISELTILTMEYLLVMGLENITGLQEKTIQKNELNLQIILTLPAAALIGILGYASYKLVSKIVAPHKLVYMPIGQALATIDRILNCNNDPAEKMSYSAHGQIIFWCSKLSNYSLQIPTQYKNSFISDLHELESNAMTVSQKLGTLNRMYRYYPFLTPAKP